MNDEGLREYSIEHLRYDIWMLHQTAQRLHSDELHQDDVLKNAVVESCVLHARLLTEFIYQRKVRGDDVPSDDYVKDRVAWAKERGTMPPILEKVSKRANKEVAHLTAKRLPDGDPQKWWPLPEVVETLHSLLKKFANHAAPERLDSTVADFIKALQPPMADPILKPTHARTTEMETAMRRDPPDVRTVAPITGPRV